MQTTVSAQVDLAALRDNLGLVRKMCPRSRIMAVVKADAYGHGLLSVARALTAADGFAVARLHEAIALREAGVAQRVLLLATRLDAADLAACSELGIDVTVHETSLVSAIVEHAQRTPLRVWLELDSGMHRTGLSSAAFIEADAILSRHPGVLELTYMTHFSGADQPNSETLDRQMNCFSRCPKASTTARISLANSAALIARPDTHADWVRPGIMLYGINPFGASHYPLPLQAAMKLAAPLIAVRHIDRGESVGYNGRWTSVRPSKIGTVGAGYGDGYPRHAPNGTPVWVRGRCVPLIGQVSMDSLSVDLTGCDARVGDEAVLWGPELSAAVVADSANTVAYELFTCVQKRVPREYLSSPRGASSSQGALGAKLAAL
jgi:alanine racemase